MTIAALQLLPKNGRSGIYRIIFKAIKRLKPIG